MKGAHMGPFFFYDKEVDGILNKIKNATTLTQGELSRVLDEVVECQMYAEAAKLRRVLADTKDPKLDGSLEEVMVRAGSVSGSAYKELHRVADNLEGVGLVVQATACRRVADRHREISMMTSEDTNPLGIRLDK